MLENILNIVDLNIVEKIAGILMIIIVVGFVYRRMTINNRKDNSKKMMRKG